jgi:hypothetical protein
LGEGITNLAALRGLGGGRYLVSAKAQFDLGDGATTDVTCSLSVEDPNGLVELDASAVTVPNSSKATIPLSGAVELSLAGGDLTLDCQGQGVQARNIKLSAIQVDELALFR